MMVLSTLWRRCSSVGSAGDGANAPSRGEVGRGPAGFALESGRGNGRNRVLGPVASGNGAYTAPPFVCISRARPEDSGVSGREATTLRGKQVPAKHGTTGATLRPLYGLK